MSSDFESLELDTSFSVSSAGSTDARGDILRAGRARVVLRDLRDIRTSVRRRLKGVTVVVSGTKQERMNKTTRAYARVDIT